LPASRTVAQHHPQVDLTSLDWPNVLVETRKWREKLAVDAKRVRSLEGNLFEIDYGGPYDVILLSHVFHHFDSPTSETLARKVAAALAPGGRVVVHDFLTDGGNPAGVMFSVTMLAWTKQGEAYASSDYAKWFKAAGLAQHTVEPVPGMPTTFFMAERER
jgi:C-methyltransferase